MSIIRVTDLVSKSLEEMTNASNSKDPNAAVRHERNAGVFARLANAQSAKTANIIDYLNSDRARWSEADETVVRVMLGLPSLSQDDEGGEEEESPAPAPEAPSPVAQPETEPLAPAPEEPTFLTEPEPSFA